MTDEQLFNEFKKNKDNLNETRNLKPNGRNTNAYPKIATQCLNTTPV